MCKEVDDGDEAGEDEKPIPPTPKPPEPPQPPPPLIKEPSTPSLVVIGDYYSDDDDQSRSGYYPAESDEN
jgi:hypothetical protein